ncbi:MAG: hypothetical protein K2N51_13020 [Lachnospiraceae bacterium]|nr:hypothetical protein [Lachnospiraceae bacterium]
MKIAKKHFERLLLLVIGLALIVYCITDCNKKTTSLKFSFSSGEKTEFEDKKSIFFNEEKDLITLDSILELEDGKITIQVIDVENNDIIWSNTYSKDEKFVIELRKIHSDYEYILSVQAEETTKFNLTITSDDKLAKEVRKPNK